MTAPTVAEMADLKTAMYERISPALWSAFSEQFGAQIVTRDLEIERLGRELVTARRDLALRDAGLCRIFRGRFILSLGGPDTASVFYRLPTGQVSALVDAQNFGLFDYVPRTISSPWDGHTPEQARESLAAFARLAGHMTLHFADTTKPLRPEELPNLGEVFKRTAAKMVCDIPCDVDCEAPCHSSHDITQKRPHQPEQCPGRGVQ